MGIKSIVILIIVLMFVAFFVFNLIKINSLSKTIKEKEIEVISLFFWKINKIPASVEIMKKYIRFEGVFEEIIYLHKLWIIYNIKSIYDLLDLNNRIHKEFIFLMKLSAKIQELQIDWNFLYVRNYVVFYEKNIEKEIEKIDILIKKYNRYIKLKNFSIIWFLWPKDEKIEL